MPLYDFKCDTCGHETVVLARIEERNRTYRCERCGGTYRRIEVSPFRIARDYEGYESPATGKWIEGRTAHREDLARSGCRIREPGETEAFIKSRESVKQELWSKAVDSAVGAAAKELGLGS